MNFKQTVYWQIYGDIFALHKKYAEPEGNDEFWSALISEADKVYTKYRASPEGEFAKSLLLAVAAEVERNYRARILNENATK